jgi:PKD repeat protein
MRSVPAPSRHPERVRPAIARGIHILAWPFLLLLVAVAPGCEDLPAAPNIPPTASFIFNPVSPITAGETPVTFNAVGSRDSDGTITSYTWDFGDGTPEQSSAAPTTVHVFTDTAARCLEITYTVLLTVVDDKGEGGTASQHVTVIEAPPPGSPQCAQ